VKHTKKFIWIRSIFIALIIIGIIWPFSFGNVCFGDAVLNFIGLKSWSGGNSGIHFTVFYSLLFFAAALIAAIKYHLSKASKIVALVLSILIILYAFSLQI
jgi:hypothetical protein